MRQLRPMDTQVPIFNQLGEDLRTKPLRGLSAVFAEIRPRPSGPLPASSL